MLNFNLFENLNLNFECFCTPKAKDDNQKYLNKAVFNSSKKFKISILPISPNYDIENLYPDSANAHLWNIFIVGSDKTYILANVKDTFNQIPNHEQLINKKGHNILPEDLFEFFDTIWNETLNSKQLQFYMVWAGKLYFINTYPLFNGKKKIIGAILFMRLFDTMPMTNFSIDGGIFINPVRFSHEEKNPSKILKKIYENNDNSNHSQKNYSKELSS